MGKPVVTAKMLAELRRLRAEKVPLREIGRRLGVSHRSLDYWCRKCKLHVRPRGRTAARVRRLWHSKMAPGAIAARLGVSAATVYAHRKRLGLPAMGRREAARYANNCMRRRGVPGGFAVAWVAERARNADAGFPQCTDADRAVVEWLALVGRGTSWGLMVYADYPRRYGANEALARCRARGYVVRCGWSGRAAVYRLADWVRARLAASGVECS